LVSDEGRFPRKPIAIALGITYGVVGSVFSTFAIFHFMSSAIDLPGFLSHLNIPPDPIIGMVMLIASILFFLGAYRTMVDLEDGRAYSIVGWFMGALVSTVSLLVMFSNAVRSLLIGTEELANWSMLDDLVPGLYLGVMVLLVIPLMVLHGKLDGRSDVKKGGGME